MENAKELQKLAQVFNTDNIITNDDIEQVLKGILVIMNSFKKDNQSLNKETKEIVENLFNKILNEHDKLKESVTRETSDTKDEVNKKLEDSIAQMKKMCEDLMLAKPKDGENGEDADEELIVEKVLSQIKLPENEILTGEDIANRLESLEGDARLDFKALKNVPESKQNIINGGGWRNLYQMHDVEISAPTDNQVLIYDGTTNTWKNETSSGGTVGPGTINEIAYFDTTTSIASLAVATYPSLTELSYVKGVTSAIQTQLGNKQPLDTQLTAIAALADAAGVLTNDGAGNMSWAAAGAGANTALSNLASVAINTTLVSDTDNTDALGTLSIAWSDLFLGNGAVINFTSSAGVSDVTLTHSSNTLTLAGGDLALGANNLTLTGSIGATGARATKVWATDIESTNEPTINGTALSSATLTFSNKTLTAPKFADLGFIADANGNELLIMDTVTSAVNEITLKNAATTTNPGLTATGGDTNVGIDVTTKGTGTFNLRGNATQPGELRLYEDTDLGTNYTAFKVGTQAADISYVLPTAQGGASTVLQNDGSGNLSWTTVGGGFDPFAGNFIVVDWSASSWSEFGSGGAISYRKASADFTSDGGGTSSRFAYVGSVSGNPLQALVTTGKVTTIQMAILNISELSANHTIYFRVENAGSETANPPSSTVRYYGFSINNGNITCGNANGTTATTTAAGTVTATETLSVLKMVITYGTDVKFYKNGTLLATHTTNLPSATTYRMMTGFVNSDTTSRGYDVGQMTMFSAY